MIYIVIVTTLINFFSWKTNANMVLIREAQSEFPAVTICNLNPFDFTTNKSTGDFVNQALLKQNASSYIELIDRINFVDEISRITDLIKAAIQSDNALTSAQVKSLGFSLETMLISCNFNGDACDASNFTWIGFDFDYGNCYTFNYQHDQLNKSKPAIYTTETGPGTGLFMELFVGNPRKKF